jgi:hypothetical protein
MAILHCRSIERRRTARAAVSIDMIMSWVDEQKEFFNYKTKTVSVSQHGGVILLQTTLPVGQRFELMNEFNRRTATCRIVSVRTNKDGKLHGAFELHCAEGNFWSMVFPSAGARPLKRSYVAKSLAG